MASVSSMGACTLLVSRRGAFRRAVSAKHYCLEGALLAEGTGEETDLAYTACS